MRRRAKREIIDALINMQKAQERLKNPMQQEQKVRFLTELQGLAIQIGEEIEKTSGTESIVKELESYCEVLYQISMEKDSAKKSFNLCAQLKSILESVQKAVEETETDKLEVVFLPYNASMWDCFDSVYQAAIKEENVNVVVMPVPYYSKDETGAFSVYNYEGEKFSEYVEITDYRKYHIEEKTPDVVFVHNPYDQYNNLTRIFPEYYSSELVKYTNHLVYIPYYISDKLTDEMQCFMPGVKYAWRVYVQSEYVRQQMLAYNEADKIKTVGSPKIDMVVNMTKNPPEIPQIWQNALKGRKVFLIVTTIVNFLNKPENIINKINQIIDFMENREEYAVIFRPHPLTEKPLKGDNLIQYKKLLQRIEGMENGVVDFSSENQRAIALSDAYIGEKSSMFTLYKASGKPMYIIDSALNLLKVEERTIQTRWAKIQDGYMWMFHKGLNALFCMEMKSGKTRYVLSVEGELREQAALYQEVFYYRKKLFLVACMADNNVQVDLTSMEQTVIPCHRKKNACGIKNANAIQEESKVYIFPRFYGDNIVIYDFETNNTKEVMVDYTDVEKKGIGIQGTFWGSGWKTKDGFYLAAYQAPELLHIGINGKQKVYRCETKNNGFLSGMLFEEKIYLLPSQGTEVIEFNTVSKKSMRLDLGKEILNSFKYCSYAKILRIKNKIYLLPYMETQIVIFDMDTQRIKTYDISTNKYWSYEVSNEKVYMLPFAGDEMIIIDCATDNITKEKIVLPLKEKNKIFFDYPVCDMLDVSRETRMYGEEICSLEQFAGASMGESSDYSEQMQKEVERFVGKTDGCSGKRIWQDILEELEREGYLSGKE